MAVTREWTIGMIGLDTSHVSAFAKLLHNSDQEHAVSGGKIKAAYPGGSPDFPLSISRVDGYTQELREQYKVDILDSPEAVAERCDALLLESVDGRVHLEQFRRIASFGKPVFVDKPFAVSYDDARRIVDLAGTHNVTFMSCSALRYAEGLTQALNRTEHGEIIGADAFGPMELQETQPGLFWYGVHTADMIYRALGRGCQRVQAISNGDHDMVVGEWADGRIGTIRGNRKGNKRFGGAVHRMEGTDYIDIHAYTKPYYASLLEQIIAMFESGEPGIDPMETLEIIRFMEAGNESRITGKSVEL
jgi:predicted dehydrogenase